MPRGTVLLLRIHVPEPVDLGRAEKEKRSCRRVLLSELDADRPPCAGTTRFVQNISVRLAIFSPFENHMRTEIPVQNHMGTENGKRREGSRRIAGGFYTYVQWGMEGPVMHDGSWG